MRLKELKIEKGDNKTINDKSLSFPLKPYTVLIGENNSGKTNLVRAFEEQSSKYHNVFYFPATSIELEKSDEASTTKKTSPFYKLLAEILKKEKLNLDKDIVGPINKKLNEITNKINNDIKFIKNKKTILRIVDVLSEEAVIKNLIPLKILDEYWEGGREVKPSEIGQGTQRMIIFTLLKYYSEQNEKNDKLNLFIIEEPEVYLHPRLKKEFNQILFSISQIENNQVLVTTHDPYFVEMNVGDNENKSIAAIRRNNVTGYTETFELKESIFPDSHSEINYLVFGLPTNSYVLELYEYLKSSQKLLLGKKNFGSNFEDFLKNNKLSSTEEYDHDNKDTKYKLTYISRFRHDIAHPKGVRNELKGKIEDVICDLRKIILTNKS